MLLQNCSFSIPIKVKIQKAVPKKENLKLALRIPEVKRLLDATTSLRDKAIILTLFQTGMSIRNLCDLTYGDVTEGLEKNEEPLHLNLMREKTWLQYSTFLGKDSIDSLKAYLNLTWNNSFEILQGTKTSLAHSRGSTKPNSNPLLKPSFLSEL